MASLPSPSAKPPPALRTYEKTREKVLAAQYNMVLHAWNRAWNRAESRTPPEVLENINVAPNMNLSLCFFHVKEDFCNKCHRDQPIVLYCKECQKPRYFKCFLTNCFNPEHWIENDFVCKYCMLPRKMLKDIPSPPPEQRASHSAWLSYEKVKFYYRKLDAVVPVYIDFLYRPRTWYRQTLSPVICFHCNTKSMKLENISQDDKRTPKVNSMIPMNVNWFCNGCKMRKHIIDEEIENYCYLCRSPMPIAQNCKSCGRFYTYYCSYPQKCITTEFPPEVGTDRWYNCPTCLKVENCSGEKREDNQTSTEDSSVITQKGFLSRIASWLPF